MSANGNFFDKERMLDQKTLLNNILSKGAIIAFCLFPVFFLFANHADALDYQVRLDADYDLDIGDRATDNDIYQYHSLDLYFLKNFTFQWQGGVRKDLDGETDESVGGEDKSDVAFRGIADAANSDKTLEYRVYSAILKYETKRFGALIGRSYLFDYEFPQFDGIMAWGHPLDWLRIEGFGGKPWHYDYIKNFSNYWGEGEFVGGAGADFLFPESRLYFYLRYLYLRELTQRNNLIGEAEDTFVSSDHVYKLKANYFYSDWMGTGLKTSFYNTSIRDIHVWAGGFFENILMSYYADYYMQLTGISDLGDRVTQFSTFLTASNPYLRFSVDLSKSFADVFNLTGPVSDILLEVTYEHRQPVNSSDESGFNPNYNMIQVGTVFATDSKWYLNIFYETVFTQDTINNLHFVGGEISKKWDKLNLGVGSSYYTNRYETQTDVSLVEDTFYAQEYYFKMKWFPLKGMDVSFKTTFERAKFKSLTDTTKINTDVVSGSADEIITDPRNYFKFDVGVGYTFGSARK